MARYTTEQTIIAHAQRIRRTSPKAIVRRYMRINQHVVDCVAPFNLIAQPYEVVAMAIHKSPLPIRTYGDTVAECLAGE